MKPALWLNQGNVEHCLTLARSSLQYAHLRRGSANGAAGLFIAANGNHCVRFGANVETSDPDLGVSAVKSTIVQAVISGYPQLLIIALTRDLPDNAPQQYRMPSGSDLQFISEFAHPEAVIVVDNIGEFRMRELLRSPLKS